MSTIGNRIFSEVRRPGRDLVEAFKGIPSSNINDEMNRLFCMHDYMRLVNPDHAVQLLGTAVTVKVPSGDNLFFHQALDMALPGDIIVVDGGHCNNRSLAGEIMLKFAQYKGLAGVVVDGCLRDLDALRGLSMPVYCAGITPQGPFKNGPGEINAPIACGGQVVFPGDILVGDMDGIVVIHKEDAPEMAAAAQKKKASEDKTFALMDGDWNAYAEKHAATTKKRMEGHTPEFLGSFADKYGL